MKKPIPLLILAHMRSGTGYISKLCQAFSLDVQHENAMGRDGLSTWLFAVYSKPPWGPYPRGYRFNHVLHMTRYPLRVIASSVYAAETWATEDVDQVFGIDPAANPIRRGVERYLHTHERILKRWHPDARFQVEHAETFLPAWLDQRRLLRAQRRRLPPHNVNAWGQMMRTYKTARLPLTWPVIAAACPAALVRSLRALAKEYGYD